MSTSASLRSILAGAVRSYQGKLQTFIQKRVTNREDVEDILQEVFYQFVRVNMLMKPVEQVGAWLFRTARNEIIDRGRKQKELPLPQFYDDEEGGWLDEDIAEALFSTSVTPEDEYLKELIRYELNAAIEKLPESQRNVFVKTELEGYSFRQLAEETGININTLLSYKHKAVMQLRNNLQNFYDEFVHS